jgi:hypothetical protein
MIIVRSLMWMIIFSVFIVRCLMRFCGVPLAKPTINQEELFETLVEQHGGFKNLSVVDMRKMTAIVSYLRPSAAGEKAAAAEDLRRLGVDPEKPSEF